MMQRISLSRLSLCGLAALFMATGAACATDEPIDDEGGGDETGDVVDLPDPISIDTPRVVLGTGIEAFEPLFPTNTIELVRGPQGGQHVNGNLRIVAPGWTLEQLESLKAEFFVYDEAGELASVPVGAFSPRLIESEDGEFSLEFGRFVYMDGLAVYDMHGSTVTYGVELFTPDGEVMERVQTQVLFVEPARVDAYDRARQRTLEVDPVAALQ